MYHDDTLAGSWPHLTERLDRTGALHRWAATEPCIAQLTGLPELLGTVRRGADPRRADEVIGALVRLAAADGGCDDEALLLLLHLLSDMVVPMCDGLAVLNDPDLRYVIVDELACQIRSYHSQQPARAYALNLKWRTRHVVLAEYVERPEAAAVSGEAIPGQAAVIPGPGDDADLDVVDVLMWAVGEGVNALDLDFLVEVERIRAEQPGIPDRALAVQLGVSLRSFYRYEARAQAAARAVGRDYLTAAA